MSATEESGTPDTFDTENAYTPTVTNTCKGMGEVCNHSKSKTSN